MTYKIETRVDTQDSTILAITQEGVEGYWTLVSTASGQDHLIRPNGRWIDASFVDSRSDTEAGRLFAWLGDQEW